VSYDWAEPAEAARALSLVLRRQSDRYSGLPTAADYLAALAAFGPIVQLRCGGEAGHSRLWAPWWSGTSRSVRERAVCGYEIEATWSCYAACELRSA